MKKYRFAFVLEFFVVVCQTPLTPTSGGASCYLKKVFNCNVTKDYLKNAAGFDKVTYMEVISGRTNTADFALESGNPSGILRSILLIKNTKIPKTIITCNLENIK